MATPTLSNVPTTINDATNITGWAASGQQSSITGAQSLIAKEGNAIEAVVRGDGGTISYTSANFSGTNQHIRGWVKYLLIGDMDFMEMVIGGNNDAFYNLFKGPGTSTTFTPDLPVYDGQWWNAVVDFNRTPDSGTSATGNVTEVGFRFQRISQPRSVDNMYVDVLRYGDGYTATGGTSGDPITLTTIADVDATSAYGVVENRGGVFEIPGALTLGSGVTATYFKAENAVVIFPDYPVSSTLYKIIGQGSGATIELKNSLFRAVSDNARFSLDFSDSNFTLICESNSFVKSRDNTFQSQSVINCSFINCGTVTTNGTVFDGCFFNSQEDAANLNPRAVSLTNSLGNTDASELTNIKSCVFTSPGRGYAIDMGTISSNVAVSVDLSNVKFSGYAAGTLGDNTGQIEPGTPNAAIRIDYRGTADLTINVVDNSDTPSLINVGSGTVTLAAPPRNFELTGLKDRTEVRLVNSSTNTEIAGVEDVIGGVGIGINNGSGSVTVSGATDNNTFNYAYQYSADTDIFAAILSSSTYEVIYLNSTLENSDKSIPIQQQEDRNSNL